jgi:hypothetical protein
MNYLPIAQLRQNFMYIERLPIITELVISPYPTISQQFLGFKKLSFVGEITTFQGHEKPEIYASYLQFVAGK